MRVVLFILVIVLCISAALAQPKPCRKKPVIVAVLDTGFGFKDQGHEAHLCKYGHKDFTIDQMFTSDYDTKMPVPVDLNAHGTNIVGLIDKFAKGNYCVVIVKYFSDTQTSIQNVESSKKALDYAERIGVDVINYSGGGPGYGAEERDTVVKFLDRGGVFVAAAGNENQDLDNPKFAYYPALYDSRVIVVGNKTNSNRKSHFSNYGKVVNTWEFGELQSGYGVTMTGTSQATAVTTGKSVNKLLNTCDK